MLERIYYWLHRLVSKPQERGEYSSGVWQDRIRVAALKLCVGVPDRILEVGCGEGLFLAQVSEANPNIGLWGVDNSSKRISLARKRLSGKNAYLSVEDATSLSFNDGYFDAVVCVNVFFNMPSMDVVKRTLAQMKRVVKNDGRLIFDFRNSQNPLLALKYKLAPYYDQTVRNLPLKTYSPDQVVKMLKEMGLEIVSEDYFGSKCKSWAPIILIEAKKI
jgi:ubiquinone/menaquinone biosynthesis C-methylase UbiE